MGKPLRFFKKTNDFRYTKIRKRIFDFRLSGIRTKTLGTTSFSSIKKGGKNVRISGTNSGYIYIYWRWFNEVAKRSIVAGHRRRSRKAGKQRIHSDPRTYERRLRVSASTFRCPGMNWGTDRTVDLAKTQVEERGMGASLIPQVSQGGGGVHKQADGPIPEKGKKPLNPAEHSMELPVVYRK